MKSFKIKKVLSTCVLLSFFLMTAIGQFTPVQDRSSSSNSILWKLDGKDLKSPSYLFGTVSGIPKGDYKIPPKVIDALNNTSRVYLEVILPTEMGKYQPYMIGAASISSQITKEEVTFVNEYLNKRLGYDLASLDDFIPLIIEKMIHDKKDTGPRRSIEDEITAYTNQVGKPLAGLSSMEELLLMAAKALTAPNYPMYIQKIEKINTPQKEIAALIDEAYRREDLIKVKRLLDEYEVFGTLEDFQKAMTERNLLWADRMSAIMTESPTFFAVKAAQLVDDSGLINLLRKKGYTVTPVLN